jgi:hypothetical protein
MSESDIDPADELLIEGRPMGVEDLEWANADQERPFSGAQEGDSAGRVADNATNLPNRAGAEEWERRRQSERSGQERAIKRAEKRSSERSSSASHEHKESNADRAKENELQAEEDGRELPA